MAYLIALIFPLLACLVVNRPGQALLNFIFIIMCWFPSVIHAVLVVMSAEQERRHQESMRAMSQQNKALVKAIRGDDQPPPLP